MKSTYFISLIFLLAIAASCTKPANEGPQDAVPQSVTDEPFNSIQDVYPDERLPENDVVTPLEINDDGDDESGPGETTQGK